MKDFFKGWIGGFLTALLLLAALISLTGCGASKKVTVNATATVHQVTTSKADTTTTKDVETKAYGDTLKGAATLPFTDSTAADTVVEQSKGVSLQIIYKPKLNKAGRITGVQLAYTAIAKPTSITQLHEVQHSNVSTTTKKDSTGKSKTVTKQSFGWGVPSWIWIILVVLALGVVIYFVKPFLKFL